MKRRERGFLLIMCLLISVLFFIMGLGLMTEREYQYRGARSLADGAIARGIAEAGLEDARVKLYYDSGFPPPSADQQPQFTYSETLTNADGTSNLGYYQVTVDKTWMGPPCSILRVTSTGVSTGGGNWSITAELDVSPTIRGTTAPNPRLGGWIDWQESGSP